MIEGDKHTPKYWVGHNKREPDVYLLFTASKRRDDTVLSMESLFGEDWFLEENLEVILIEINKIQL